MIKKIGKVILIVIAVITAAVILFINFWPSLGSAPSREDQAEYQKRASNFYDGTFHGVPEISVMSGETSDFSRDEQTTPLGTIPVNKLTEIPSAAEDEMKLTWFGHSSAMLQMQGLNILIDPVLSEYSSPVAGFGSKRFSEIPIEAEDLPEIDILVLSHDHYDHMDYDTIKKVDNKIKQYCVPLGVENHLIRWGIDESKINVMAWWDSVEIDGLEVVSTPGRHYTGRLPWQGNSTLWSGYVFKNNQYTTYYTGDTGYGDFFQEIADKYGPIDLMLLENGQYDKSWSAIHMLPEQGIEAVKTMQASWVVPIHWGAFSLGYHPWDDPIKQISSLAEQENINLATPKIGEIVDFENIQDYQEKWWEGVDDSSAPAQN